MPARIFSSQDADAPVLTGEPGTMVNLLRKVLVDGYGSGDQETQPLGWHMEWDDATNQQAAFRSNDPEATQFWLVLDDRGVGDHFGPPHVWADGRICYARGAHSFSGWDGSGVPQMTNPFPTAEQRENIDPVDFHKSGQNDSQEKAWIVIGDEKRFYLFIRGYFDEFTVGNSNLRSVSVHFFGDYIPFLPSDTSPCMIAGSEDNTATSESGWTTRCQWLSRETNNLFYLANHPYKSEFSTVAGMRYTDRRGLQNIGPEWDDLDQLSTATLLLTHEPYIHHYEDEDTVFENVIRGRMPFFRRLRVNSSAADSTQFYRDWFGPDGSKAFGMITLPGAGEFFACPIDGSSYDQGIAFFDLEDE